MRHLSAKSRLAASLAGLIAAAWTGAAAAQDPTALATINTPHLESGNMYVSFGGGILFDEMPDYNSGNTTALGAFTGPFDFNESDTLAMGTGGLTVGHAVPGGGLLPDWAERERIEAWFAGAAGEDTTRKFAQPQFGTLNRKTSIDGRNSLVFGNPPGFTRTSILQTDAGMLGGGLRYRFDVQASDDLTLMPFLGMTIGHSSRDYTYRQFGGTPFVSLTTQQIDEELDSFEFGGEIGMDARYKLTNALHIVGGFRFMPTSVDTDYSGRDCIGAPAGLGNFNCYNNPIFTSSATDREVKLALRVGLRGGFVWQGDWWALSVIGFGNWNSAAPTIRHPSALAPAQPARIDHESVWSYGAAVRADISLY